MTIPDSEREHVFNVKKSALTGVWSGDRIFITAAASAVLGVLTRIEKVRETSSQFVETQTGRRFSRITGRGLKELDRACVACKLTHKLEAAFKQFVRFRRSVKWLKTYDFSVMPESVVQKITALVQEGEAENKRLRGAGRHVDKSLSEVLAPVFVPVETFEVKNPQKGLAGFKLPPLTEEIVLIRGQFRAITSYGKVFNLKDSSGVTRRKLIGRTALAYFKHTRTIDEYIP